MLPALLPSPLISSPSSSPFKSNDRDLEFTPLIGGKLIFLLLPNPLGTYPVVSIKKLTEGYPSMFCGYLKADFVSW
jgi:hypothetical protein